MGDYIVLQIFIDKKKEMIIVPYKLCKIGYALAVEPYRKVNSADWEADWKIVYKEVTELLKEISKQPRTEQTESTVMKEICGERDLNNFQRSIFV